MRSFETMRAGGYRYIEVESYLPAYTSGLHGAVHVRPVAGQGFPTDMHVSCSRSLKRDYPPGTRFRLLAKPSQREDGGEYLYANPRDQPDPIS